MRICPVCTQAFAPTDVRCPTDGVALVSLEGAATTGQVPAADLTGQVIDGRFRVESVIGRGGMGLVYSCRHIVVGKRFAMKVLKPGVERTEDILARFIREAQAANAVKSPHIAEASDFGQLASGHFYVIMELLEGRSLASALKERALTRDELLFVFTQIAETLWQTHQAGIVHRDLKPDNVYLVRDPASPQGPDTKPLFVKLLDFGVAKVLGSNDPSLTQSGVILGTPYYMAPEQARGQEIDHRADIYSLGVMMYHAFTGRLPFIADSAVAVMTAHALDAPQPPSQISSVDAGVEQIILRCMEKRPAARFSTMREVAEHLRHLRGLGGGAMLPPAPYGPLARVDTQSGASLSGAHGSVPGSIGATQSTRATSNGILLFAVASVGMLVLGGLVAVALIVRRPVSAPPPASTQAAAAPPTATATPSVAALPIPSATQAAPAPHAPASALASASAPAPLPPQAGNVHRPPPQQPTATATAQYSPELTNPFHHP